MILLPSLFPCQNNYVNLLSQNYWKIFNLFKLFLFVLTKTGTGAIIYELRKKIQQAQFDLKQLGEPISDLPELVSSANLLRSNEYLTKANDKKSELISAYEQHSIALEELLSTVFEIQKDLQEILKEQSSMISSPRKKQIRSKSKAKTKK